MTAAIIAQIYYLLKTHLARSKKKKLMTLISTLQVLSPSQLIDKLQHSNGPEITQLCKGKIYAG